MESISERKFLSPNLSEETVLATKVSGFSDPFLTLLMTQIQSFAFYNDLITISDKNYVNPIIFIGLQNMNITEFEVGIKYDPNLKRIKGLDYEVFLAGQLTKPVLELEYKTSHSAFSDFSYNSIDIRIRQVFQTKYYRLFHFVAV